jgi:hypothetical protein
MSARKMGVYVPLPWEDIGMCADVNREDMYVRTSGKKGGGGDTKIETDFNDGLDIRIAQKKLYVVDDLLWNRGAFRLVGIVYFL